MRVASWQQKITVYNDQYIRLRAVGGRCGDAQSTSLCSKCLSYVLSSAYDSLWPQAIPTLASHAWLRQLLACDTRANRSASIRIIRQGWVYEYLSVPLEA